jgi:hypothetical protein
VLSHVATGFIKLLARELAEGLLHPRESAGAVRDGTAAGECHHNHEGMGHAEDTSERESESSL